MTNRRFGAIIAGQRGRGRSGVRPGRFARRPSPWPLTMHDLRSFGVHVWRRDKRQLTQADVLSTLRVCIWSMHAANTWLGSEVHALIDAPDDRRAFRSVQRMRAYLVQLLAARDLAISRSRNLAISRRRLGASPRRTLATAEERSHNRSLRGVYCYNWASLRGFSCVLRSVNGLGCAVFIRARA